MLGSIPYLEPWMHSHVDMVVMNWVVLAEAYIYIYIYKGGASWSYCN